jgi:hypothetical protein
MRDEACTGARRVIARSRTGRALTPSGAQTPNPVSVTRVGGLTPAGHQADGEAVDPSGCAALRGSTPPCWRHVSSAPRQATCRSLAGFGPSQYAPSRDIPPGGWDRCRTTDNNIRRLVVDVSPEVVLSPRPSSSWSSTGAARKAVDGEDADVGERVDVVENIIC